MNFKLQYLNSSPQAREELVYQSAIKIPRSQIQANLVPVTIENSNHDKITYFVSKDYFSIDDFRVPMTALTAQKICDYFNMRLPTSKMSQQIWQAAQTKMRATPLSSSGYSWRGEKFSPQDVVKSKIGDPVAALIYNARTSKMLENVRNSGLIAGHGKDILQPLSSSNRLSIGGWQGQDTKALQPYSSPHDAATQVEYGTWMRLVDNKVVINKNSGEEIVTTLDEFLNDINSYSILSNQKGSKSYSKSKVQEAKKNSTLPAQSDWMQKLDQFLNKFNI